MKTNQPERYYTLAIIAIVAIVALFVMMSNSPAQANTFTYKTPSVGLATGGCAGTQTSFCEDGVTETWSIDPDTCELMGPPEQRQCNNGCNDDGDGCWMPGGFNLQPGWRDILNGNEWRRMWGRE